MIFKLPDLPYERNALEPYVSAETLDFHHGKHHNAYVTKLNELVTGTEYDGKSLEEIIKATSGAMFNQAAQIWNHTFYWNSLSPTGGGEPSGDLGAAIVAAFGSFDEFKVAFNAKVVATFGSGWTWLVKNTEGKLDIVNTDDADTPIAREGQAPLLVADVWEHAYYIDYRNARPKYLEAFWSIVNWEFASENFAV